MLKLALVGCGGIAQAHWAGIQAHAPQIRVTAVVDTDPGRAAQMATATGARAYGTLAEALAGGDFAAVDLMLPHHQHEAAALACLAAGRHVLLEKPLSTDLASCARILTAARAAGTFFMVAEQAQYWADAIAVRQLIQAGDLGQIVCARALFGGGAARPLGDAPRPWRYLLAEAGGGLAIDGGAHWIRPLRMWLGEVEEVVATLGHPVADMEGESLVQALLRFDRGVVASFDAFRAGFGPGPADEFRVVGSAGEVVVERGRGGRVLLFDQRTPQGRVVLADKDPGRQAAFGLELADFANAVLTGAPVAASAEHSLGELRTALAIYASAARREWVRVWD